MPLIVARYESRCRICHLQIVTGERIDFTRSTGARHLTCADEHGTDPEEEIRDAYAVWRTSGFLEDERAFDECVNRYGYLHAVRALYSVSDHAKRREDAYRARRVAS